MNNVIANLVHAKSILINYLENNICDEDAIEYLIETIDYLINGKIPLEDEILRIIIEEIVVTSTFNKSTDILKVVGLVNEVRKEVLNV